MLTIEPERANAVPRTLLLLCVVLLILRLGVISYGTWCPPPPPAKLLTWQDPAPVDPDRKDLLSTPMLYYFCNTHDMMNSFWTRLFESALFNNREVVEAINKNFQSVKVDFNPDKPDALAKQLSDKFSVSIYPNVVVA